MNELQRIKPIFEQALDREGEDRRAYLDEACGTEPLLRRKVEALLQAHEQAQGFLESPVFGAEVSPGESPLSEGPGTIIGRYKLLEKIGEGGMAVVYMAEQTEPIRRKVALKIIKLGMDTRQVIARFEAERQALALMDHPSIAKVLDAGATETGRPYFVMELVTGVSITEYCDKNSLSTKDRLTLFLQVCHAVQHAHQKGIIHRDIKPSNVMVTHHDGKPVPKVIDFGIAKATNQKLTEKTLFTRYAHIIGTPAYMSPEQAELSDLDIDTRSDIYSLGVLLYELLTGTTPFSKEELRKAGYLEMQRVIREQEPVRPSTRIRTATRERRSPDRLSSDGQSGDWRSQGPRGPAYQQVRGDLDWIVMKSLEKERAQRYETASSLAEDIRRHLEHEPVLARGPSTMYRLRKFLRRHRVQVLVGLTLAASLALVAVILSIWNQDRLQWNQNRLQLAEAERLQHQSRLDRAQDQYAKAQREAALSTIQPILRSPHVGAEAQLLRAAILVDNRRPAEATTILENLLDERREIAGAAHALLARILWEGEALDAEKLQQIEEHRQKAEALRPDTAEAYFLQAMTGVTIKEQLAALDKALQLSPQHYESLRLRAFTYYASRKYDRLREDARVMTILRPGDPLGYSLRAAALQEQGKYEDALAEYDNAMAHTAKDDRRYLDLAAQRSETLLRKGDYERVIAEAEANGADNPVFRYHRFCAFTASGEYDQAAAVFQEIVQTAPTARNEFRFWATEYVLDTLAAGRSWHPPDRKPAGAAFLPLLEAEEAYRGLSAKGRRVLTDGFNAQWSPDGTKLAFNLGVRGYSGVAVFDPATKETELLIVPGKNPQWSPDGRYIAFARDRQFMRVEELVATDLKSQSQPRTDEEVWLMESDGTKPRRLARGAWPSWGRDSTHIYYQSPLDSALYSISITDSNIRPERMLTGPLFCPSVSPDNRRVAYLSPNGPSLKVSDLASQAVVAQWDPPFGIWSPPAWSPTGEELAVGAGSSAGDRTGLWIYRLDGREHVKVLDSQIMSAAWASDGTNLIFGLRPPYFELWAADLNPAISTIKALGPGQTLDEHWRQMLDLYQERIRVDPKDASAYSDRARYYDYLHERLKAQADMRRWSAAVGGPSLSDSWFGTLGNRRYVIDMPFNCELVFSAERLTNQIPVMSIAFGQKGRCEMKLFGIPMVVPSLLGLCLLSGLDVPPTRADFTFGELVCTRTGAWYASCISADGLDIYFHLGDDYNARIWTAHRAAPDDAWGPPSDLGPIINGPGFNGTPWITPNKLELYFASDQSGSYGSNDIWVTRRATVDDNWGIPVNMGAAVNSAFRDGAPNLSADGLELYFVSNRPGSYGDWDLWVTTRATVNDDWGTPVNLGPTINTAYREIFPCVSADGLLLVFSSLRPGGNGNLDLYLARRATTKDAWTTPVNLGPAINSSAHENGPRISADGSLLYFFSSRPGGVGGWDSWQAPILRTIDFNGDGKVDAKEMTLLVDNWGKSNSVCDIGPFAWGDGVVDERDLRVLMESLMTPGPNASDVPSDVILSWVSPSFAQTCDVYFGTSQEAVKTASRTNPQSVLVSQGQTATTYDPPGLLEFTKTYYWRVDFVISSPAPAIYQGPVLKFTTEAYARPFKNITATASSFQRSMGPEKTVDGAGLDQNDGHSTTGSDMWLSQGTQPNWIQYQFDKVYALHELWVWNSNQLVEPFIGFGAKTVKIEYSTDGTKWTRLANVPEFARASGQPGYIHNTTVSFGGVSAKYVKLTIEKGWGATPSVGLSEVRFFYIPDRSTPKP